MNRRKFLANSTLAAASALALRTPLLALQQTQPLNQNSGQNQAQTLLQSMRAAAATAPIQTTKLTDTVYLFQGVGANVVVLNGPDGKLLIDSGMATGVPHLLDTLTKIGPNPLRLLVNTSWLFTHTDGNAALNAAGAFIIGQENIRLHLSGPQSVPMLNVTLPPAAHSALPEATFTDSEKIYTNNEQLDLVHAPNASTDSDTLIHFQNANILHAGELWFNKAYPILDASSGGSINGLIQAVDQLLRLADDRTKIVPSHGNAGDKTALAAYREMLVTVANRIERAKIAGQSINEVLAAKPTADLDAEWSHGEMTPAMFVTAIYDTL
jgi:glyoxylase-like metal-dependent hydrolase (beta-lactamase superfamily II)